jgi:tetratricopeptide (TPR) repeat protein
MPSSSDAPALALPDHTVFVDMEAPWEEEPTKGGSNKAIYLVLGFLLLGLTGFSGYIYWQRSQLSKPAPVAEKQKGADSVSVGSTYLKMAQQSFKNKKWEEAQQSAELARDLIVPLKVAPAAKVKEVKRFFEKATTRCAQSMFEKANRAAQAGDTRQALGYCRDSVKMYGKLPKTGKLQAQAYGLEGRIYERDGDLASAQSAYLKAHSLYPGGGYAEQARRTRSAGAPAQPVPTNTGAEQPSVVQPSLGGDPLYPSGRNPGGYRPSGPAPAQPVVSAQPSQPRPRPVNTYVPPKKQSKQPRKSDQLPTY